VSGAIKHDATPVPPLTRLIQRMCRTSTVTPIVASAAIFVQFSVDVPLNGDSVQFEEDFGGRCGVRRRHGYLHHADIRGSGARW
jgi:hypothetical protein